MFLYGLVVASIVGGVDSDSVAPADRIAYVNRLADRQTGPNAWQHYKSAIERKVELYELAIDEEDQSRKDALSYVGVKIHSLARADQWSLSEALALRAWLDANEATLELVRKASRRTRCHIPLADDTGRLHAAVTNSSGTEFLGLARLVAIKANDCAHRGLWDEAYRWNSRVHRMASHVYQRPHFFHHLAATGLERSACTQMLVFFRRHYPKNGPALLDDIKSGVKTRCPIELTEKAEALWIRDYIEAWHEWAEDPSRHSNLTESIEFLFSEQRLDDADTEILAGLWGASPFRSADEFRKALASTSVEEELTVARRIDAAFEKWNGLPSHKAWEQISEFERRYCEIVKASPSLSVYGCGAISSTLLPLFREISDLYREAVTCVAAIHEFRRAKGRLPNRLEGLRPDFVDMVPIDPFSGSPLIYRAAEDGKGFTVYSVGLDQVDDGGKHQRLTRDPGDIVFWPPPPAHVTD